METFVALTKTDFILKNICRCVLVLNRPVCQRQYDMDGAGALFVTEGHLVHSGKWVRGTGKIFLADAQTQTFVKASLALRAIYQACVEQLSHRTVRRSPIVLTLLVDSNNIPVCWSIYGPLRYI